MKKVPKWIEKAALLAISRVRYESANLGGDLETATVTTEKIRKATKVYTESWIVPLLKAIAKGDRRMAELMTSHYGDVVRIHKVRKEIKEEQD